MKRTVENLIISILLHGIVIIGVYFAVQPDPKGIGFAVSLMLYSWLIGLLGVVIIVFNVNPYRFWYQFIMIGTLIYVYDLINLVFYGYKIEFNFIHGIMLAGLGVCLILWLNFIETTFSKKR